MELDLSGSNDDYNTARAVPLSRLLLSLTAPLIAIIFSYLMRINLETQIIVSLTRLVLQLLLAGYVLLSYIFSVKSPIAVITYLLVMTYVAALEATSAKERTYKGHFNDSVIALLVGGTVFGFLFSMVAFSPNPWWEPQVIVPTVGMIVGNAISGPAVAVDLFLMLVTDQKHMVDTRLSFGSTGYEAVLPFVKQGITASLLPMLNRMSVVGIVSIPGMMAGQLLGGAPPLVAAEYQMVIFWILCGTSTISVYVAIFLAIYNASIDKSHHLTLNRIIKIKKTKKTIDVLIYESIVDFFTEIKNMFVSFCTYCFTSKNKKNYQKIAENSINYDVETLTEESLLVPPPSDAPTTYTEDNVLSNPTGIRGIFRVHFSIEENEAFDASAAPILTITSLNLLVNDIPLFDPSIGLNLTVKQGERIAIQGPSGIGKTCLLRVLAKLDNSIAGEVKFLLPLEEILSDQKSCCSCCCKCNCCTQCLKSFFCCRDGDYDVPKHRRQVLYVPQALPPMTLSPQAFIIECLEFHSRKSLEIFQNIKNNIELLCKNMELKLGLSEGKLSEEWSNLSGGERQRAVIGCALILANISDGNSKHPPMMLLFDEPTAACDPVSTQLVEKAIIDSNVTVMLITHDASQAVRLCNKRLVLTATS